MPEHFELSTDRLLDALAWTAYESHRRVITAYAAAAHVHEHEALDALHAFYERSRPAVTDESAAARQPR